MHTKGCSTPGVGLSCLLCPSRSEGVFSTLEQALLIEADDCKQDLRVERGAWLFRDGDPVTHLYCVFDGAITVMTSSRKAKPGVIGLAKEGELLGLSDLLLKRPHSNAARVSRSARVCSFPFTFIHDLIAKRQDVVRRVTQHLLQRIEDLETEGFQHQVMTLEQKLMTLLSRISRAGEEAMEGTLTQQEMAALIGTSRETVKRLLRKLKQDGALEQMGRMYTVKA